MREETKARKTKRPIAPPRITEAEWVVMKALWERAPQTTNEVVATLEKQTAWKPKTIHTLLRRLALKGALTFEKNGREYVFSPRVTAEACEQEAMRSFLGRFFEGEFAPFLARFLEREKLEPEEVQELKRILERKRT